MKEEHAKQIVNVALDMVAIARSRQIQEKGHTDERDDQLRVMSVQQQMLAESTFEVFRSAWSPWGPSRTNEASRPFASWSGGE